MLTKKHKANDKEGVSRPNRGQARFERPMVLTVVEDFMKIIQSSVADGQRIFLRGFGVFQPKERKAKVGRNITRGEQLSIPPKRVPQFRPYPHFKKVVEKGK